MKLYCWNTNGIRGAVKNGMLDWLEKERPDVLCLQETKASDPQTVLDETVLSPKGYRTHWNWPLEKKGYSGVAIFSKTEPDAIEKGFGIGALDKEGRFSSRITRHLPSSIATFPTANRARNG